MKVLFTILTNHTSQHQADACMDTWVKKIKPPHDYYFYGSEPQSRAMEKCWNCSPQLGEHRWRLPEKTFNMLVESLNHEWDFLYKCDDDTYVNPDNLALELERYQNRKSLFLGFIPISRFDISKPKHNTLTHLNNFKQYNQYMKTSHDLGVNNFDLSEFQYAQGGVGYVLSRDVVERIARDGYKKIFTAYDTQSDICDLHTNAEDFSVAYTCLHENIKLETVTNWTPGKFKNFGKKFTDRLYHEKGSIQNYIDNKHNVQVSWHHVGPTGMTLINNFSTN